MTASFAGRARVASGAAPSRRAEPYRVQVRDGRLDLALDATGGPVLGVELTRVVARPLGRAGAVVVEVGGEPLLVDFTDRRHDTGPAHVARRALHALAGRRARRAFLAAVGR